MTLLALDLATVTGFATGTPDSGVLEYGSHRLEKTGDDVGRYLVEFREWLKATITRVQPWTVFFESPVMMGRNNTTLIALRKLYGLADVTEMVACDLGLDCREANVSDIQTHFCGKGSPRFGIKRKQATIAKCRERGWRPADDNQADALALLDYALSLIQPERALEATPLFAGAPA